MTRVRACTILCRTLGFWARGKASLTSKYRRSLRFNFALCSSVWFHVSPYPLYRGTVYRSGNRCTWSILGKDFQLHTAAVRRDRVWLVGVETFHRRAPNMVVRIVDVI